jgi:hypothetical protein
MTVKQVLSQLAFAVLALAPVAAVVAFFRAAHQHHPVVTVIVLVAWGLLLLIGRFLGSVAAKLQELWAVQLATWVDALLRRTISRYSRHYRYFLSHMHHDVDLRGLSPWGLRNLAMDEVFVDLSLMPELAHRVPTGPVESDHHAGDSAPDAGASAGDAARQSIWQMLERRPDGPLAVLGPPGSGKTTLLRHVTLALCGYQRQFAIPRRWRGRVPALLFLREHAADILGNPDLSLADAIRKTLARLPRKEPPGWLEAQLDAGRCIVMLDGLDEVPKREDRIKVMAWVRHQLASYPKNRFILTSRPGGFADPPHLTAVTVKVREFTDAQIRRFVQGWYLAVEQRSAKRSDVGVQARAEDGASHLLDRVYASPALLALAANPLLLTMIVSVHRDRAALPGSRAELYREICQVFLGKRQEVKQLPSSLSIDQQLLVLRRLAFGMMVGRVRIIPASEAAVMIKPIMQRVGYPGSAEDFLHEIEHNAGLLIEREQGVYSFVHHTFQEYLAALHLAEEASMDFLAGQVNDAWWREVILFRIAAADATPILRSILAVPSPTAELLSLADDCLEQARDIEADVRKEALELLSWRPGDPDPERRRLVASVLLRRKLRRVVRTGSGTFVCPEPVTNAEFAMFLEDAGFQAPDGRAIPAQHAPLGTPEQPVSGVGIREADRFAEWAKSIGVEVALPNVNELTTIDMQRLGLPPEMRFWMRSDNFDRLWDDWEEPTWGIQRVCSLTAVNTNAVDEISTFLKGQLHSDAYRVLERFAPDLPPYVRMDESSGWPVVEWGSFKTDVDRFWPGDAIRGPFDRPFPDAWLATILPPRFSSGTFVGPPMDARGTVPDPYRELWHGVVNCLQQEFKVSAHWLTPQYLTYKSGDAAPLIGDSSEAACLRAHLRLMAWGQLIDSFEDMRRWLPNRAYATRLLAGTLSALLPRYRLYREGVSEFDIRKWELHRMMVVLARQYLYEWREDGTLAPNEGILLGRV